MNDSIAINEMDEEQLVEKMNIFMNRINSYDMYQFSSLLIIDSARFIEFMAYLLAKERELKYDSPALPFDMLIKEKVISKNLFEKLRNVRKIRNEYVHGVIENITEKQFNEIKMVMDVLFSWLATSDPAFQKYSFYQTAVVKKVNDKVDELIKSQNVIIKTLKERNEYLEKSIDQIIDNQNKMISKMDSISHDIRQISSSIVDYQRFVSKLAERTTSEENLEMLMQLYSDECVEKIESKMSDVTTKGQYNNICNSLKEILGESNYYKLDEESKSFIVSSRIMYKNLECFSDDVDYSGVCLLMTKALEKTCKKKFYTDLLPYLRKRYKVSSYPSSLLNALNGKEIKEEEFTLGTIPYLLTFKKGENYIENDRNIILQYCKDVLFINSTDNHVLKKILEIGESIDTIRTRYRNPSAHIGSINKIKARECMDYILDVQNVLKSILNEFKS